ncbi:hypothetical protein UREOM_3040 [Ureaplasma sp. OM1]|uniref:Uncharacterized protein n=1 Tax=Ureaplasma ceti TaxID=3119530 RepID=A0ABP9U5H4_9BACT
MDLLRLVNKVNAAIAINNKIMSPNIDALFLKTYRSVFLNKFRMHLYSFLWSFIKKTRREERAVFLFVTNSKLHFLKKLILSIYRKVSVFLSIIKL